MNKTYLSYNNIVSALGFDSPRVVQNIHEGISGITLIEDENLFPNPFYASIIDSNSLKEAFGLLGPNSDYTRLEQMMIMSLDKIIKESSVKLTDRVGLIISTTKGNIDTLDPTNPMPKERAYLGTLGHIIKNYFRFVTEPIVLSNACVSGILAISIAKRFIAQGTFDQVFIVGGDIVSNFILSGFNSFQAMSPLPCKPYCKERSGINIGEVAASVLVTTEQKKLVPEAVEIMGEASCNDANHISGPSRTGEGLYRSIQSAFKEANAGPQDIDYISAHGTATNFNDEMEAIALNRLDLGGVPLNSLKGYFGHTLGGSGLLETIVGMHSLYHNTLYPSIGFTELGVSQPLNIIRATTAKKLDCFLKTASGFGGCNTAAVFKKVQS
ncbi:beta-ketoacyl synthase N-terminal-like domain-containing protein [Arenibacter sp. F20364]|uniref:beta-ketoacyl-[acyl-carrier-protein] synthase family protein n=1 Tax=Arenibacter sp. F20364 TaxID=2926415 RepID=UPI001FF486BE|nr:beta-ketoacyl synthase N-terminal-like domain-containing protein [Arenibacter sp. F20364]MCK0188579.1 beta-ketoacyl synthase [Arenibacter sp. F20364]